MTNMKPADELLSIRDRQRELKAREEEIRDGMIAGELSLDGDGCFFEMKETVTNRLDQAKLKKTLGDLAPYRVASTSVRMMVTRRDELEATQ